MQTTPEWSLSSYFWDQIWKIPYNFRCWSGISVEGREPISSKEGWAAIVAISKASKSRATSVASKARAKAQPAEAAASTAAAEAQAAEASVAAAQASVVAAAVAHGVRGWVWFAVKARTWVWMSAHAEGCLYTLVRACDKSHVYPRVSHVSIIHTWQATYLAQLISSLFPDTGRRPHTR